MSTRTVRLDEVCDINPRMPKILADEDVVSFLPMAAVSEDGLINFEEQRAFREVKKGYTYFERGDVLLAKITPCFENGKATRTLSLKQAHGFGSTEFHVLRPLKSVDSSYLFHMIWNSKFRALGAGNMSGSAGQKRIPAEFLKRVEIPLPTLNEQRRIAAILDKADALRCKSKKVLGLADRFNEALYRQTFGDPVENPLGFRAATLGDLSVQMVYGPRFYNEKYSPTGTRIVRITDLAESGELDYQQMPRLDVSNDDLRNHQSTAGELLFARTGATVGKVALISAKDPISIPGAYFIRLRFPPNIIPTFAWHTLRSRPIQKLIAERSRQSAQQNFSGPALRRLPFIVPPIDLQKEFAIRVAAVSKLKAHGRNRMASSVKLVQDIQNRAFSGELQ